MARSPNKFQQHVIRRLQDRIRQIGEMNEGGKKLEYTAAQAAETHFKLQIALRKTFDMNLRGK